MKSAILGRVIEEEPRFEARWQRQVRRQIYLPLAVGSVLVAAVIVALLWGGEGSARLWADLALIYLCAAAGVVGLLLLVVVGGLAYGIGWLTGRIPEPARRARRIAAKVRAEARRGANALAAPAVRAGALWASLRAIPGAMRSGARRR